MSLEDINIKEIIASVPGTASLATRLAPQEMDMLVSVLYQGLSEGLQKISQKGFTDPDAIYKLLLENVSAQLASIETVVAIKDLPKKFNVDLFLKKVLIQL